MNTQLTSIPTAAEHTQAFTEVAFLVDIFAATIDNIMGGATSSVGRIAGREMAKKLPLDLVKPTTDESLHVIASSLKKGFDIAHSQELGTTLITIHRCVIRDVCEQRKLELGGSLCKLFHSYFDGMMNELISRPTKSELVDCGTQCRICMKIQ